MKGFGAGRRSGQLFACNCPGSPPASHSGYSRQALARRGREGPGRTGERPGRGRVGAGKGPGRLSTEEGVVIRRFFEHRGRDGSLAVLGSHENPHIIFDMVSMLLIYIYIYICVYKRW